MNFGKKSIECLNSCDVRLQRVAFKALSYNELDFSITQGHRSLADQLIAFQTGHSERDGIHIKSNHNYFPSLAFDFIPYPFAGWDDIDAFKAVADLLLRAAKELDIGVRWGGIFKMKDYPHLEIFPA